MHAADAVILLLGGRYGAVQTSGLSATHEEFREARDRKPVFAFVQSGLTPEASQTEFITEVQAWSTGSFTERFESPETLQRLVTRAIHRWQLASASGQVDGEEMEQRAIAALPEERRGMISGRKLAISVVGAPRQTILRPSQLEAATFHRDLTRRALFGDPAIFSTTSGTETVIGNHNLTLTQNNSLLRVSEDGALMLVLKLPDVGTSLPAIIQEDVQELLATALRFVVETLNEIDPTERLSHLAVAVGMLDSSYSGWRTRREHTQNPNSMTIGHRSTESPVRVTLSPPHRTRPAFRQQTQEIAEDLTLLLRRELQR